MTKKAEKAETKPVVRTITIRQSALKTALSRVADVPLVKPTLPVLETVLLEQKGTELWMTGTDLEITVTTKVEAVFDTMISEPIACLPARKLLELVASFTNEDITMNIDALGIAKLQCGSSKSKLIGLPAEEFPPRPTYAEDLGHFSLDADAISLLKMVNLAASTDNNRPILTCVNLMVVAGDKKVYLSAADGFRAAMADFPVEKSISTNMNIPPKGVKEIIRLGPGKMYPVTVDQPKLAYVNENTTLFIQLITGNYPDLKQVKPHNYTTTITATRADIESAVKLATIFAKDSSYLIGINVDQNGLELTGVSSERGSTQTSVPCTLSGQPIKIAANATFFRQGVLATNTNQVRIDFVAPQSPLLITPVGGSTLNYVLMPMWKGEEDSAVEVAKAAEAAEAQGV